MVAQDAKIATSLIDGIGTDVRSLIV